MQRFCFFWDLPNFLHKKCTLNRIFAIETHFCDEVWVKGVHFLRERSWFEGERRLFWREHFLPFEDFLLGRLRNFCLVVWRFGAELPETNYQKLVMIPYNTNSWTGSSHSKVYLFYNPGRAISHFRLYYVSMSHIAILPSTLAI